jgi:hypothetical protein
MPPAQFKVTNGICLCALHHKLSDKGALGMTSDQRVPAFLDAAEAVRDRTGHRSYRRETARRLSRSGLGRVAGDVDGRSRSGLS